MNNQTEPDSGYGPRANEEAALISLADIYCSWYEIFTLRHSTEEKCAGIAKAAALCRRDIVAFASKSHLSNTAVL